MQEPVIVTSDHGRGPANEGLQRLVREEELHEHFKTLYGEMEAQQIREMCYSFEPEASKTPPYYWVFLERGSTELNSALTHSTGVSLERRSEDIPSIAPAHSTEMSSDHSSTELNSTPHPEANKDRSTIFHEVFPKHYQISWKDEPHELETVTCYHTVATITNNSLPATHAAMTEAEYSAILLGVKKHFINDGVEEMSQSLYSRSSGRHVTVDLPHREAMFRDFFGDNYEIIFTLENNMIDGHPFQYNTLLIRRKEGADAALPIRQEFAVKTEFLGWLHKKRAEMTRLGRCTLTMSGDQADVFLVISLASRDKLVHTAFGKRCRIEWAEEQRVLYGQTYHYTTLYVAMPITGR
jgi:hypothetical protein